MSTKSPYRVLGVPETASAEDIRRAYLERARELHPDTGNPGATHERFVELQAAYDCLGDDLRRREYDAAQRGRMRGPVSPRPAWAERRSVMEDLLGESPWAVLEDIFPGVGFGRLARRVPPGPGQLQVELRVRPEQALAGAVLTVQVPALTRCVTCGGAGGLQGRRCWDCRGEGRRRQTVPVPVRVPAFSGRSTLVRSSVSLAGGVEVELLVRVVVEG
jgi:molecular chaperone DnaJ